jgi:thiol-disulfide isomerase/thioredoxin
MAKAKSRKSTGQSREQQRESQYNKQQSRGSVAATRQQRIESRQRNQRKRTTPNMRPWIWVGGVVLVVAVIVVIFIYLSHQSSGGGSTTAQPTPAGSTVLQEVTHVDPSVASAVGGGGSTPPTPINGKPLLTDSGGKPIIFYDGAEYCPYCAAERWGVVVALSRFGTFSKLNTTTSSATDVYPSTHTFTFYQSSYQSSYIDFLSVEETTNQSDGNGGYTPLQTPNQQEQQILDSLNSQGAIPFIDIANKYTVTDAGYDPGVLQNMTWDEIASNLSNPDSPVTKGIVGTANYLTAAICMTTNQQPASACSVPVIQQLEQSLGKSAVGGSGAQVGYSAYPFEANVRRTGISGQI